jgi:predicted O-methyltransferase YrrM
MTKTNLHLGFVRFIRDLLDISTFIETGTGLGRTTAVVAQMFAHVYTVEAHEGRYKDATRMFLDQPHVQCLHGNSADVLPSLLGAIPDRCLFFLDAHCGYRQLCAPTGCPLLREISAVLSHRSDHVIVIDDLDWFAKVPPTDVVPRDHYPELPVVLDALRAGGNDPFIFLLGNCIVSVPRSGQPDVERFLRRET